jgi:hypothetical protein
MIRWYVNKFIHVSTPDRVLIRDFYNRIKASGVPHTREDRRAVYLEALDQHHANQDLYHSVICGRF